MNKYWWWILVPCMLIFWVANLVVTSYGLLHLGASLVWAVILAILSCMVDLGLVFDITSREKIETEQSTAESTLLFFSWMITIFLNAIVIGWATVVFCPALLESVIFVGLLYLVMRLAFFLIVPAYITASENTSPI